MCMDVWVDQWRTLDGVLEVKMLLFFFFLFVFFPLIVSVDFILNFFASW